MRISKINKILFIFIIIGCILAAAYITRSMPDTQAENSSVNTITSDVTNITVPVSGTSTTRKGQILVSIGKYDAQLPVFIDNIKSGEVSKDRPLILELSEGSHTVGVCDGTICETMDIQTENSLKTTIDFEDWLNNNIPQGLLNVSIGDFNARLPVSIDNTSAGTLSSGMPLSRFVSVGQHSVKICINDNCYAEDVDIKPRSETTLDFKDRLESEGLQTELIVSIGGYNAQLPVVVDNMSVGFVSQANPLTVNVLPGMHELKVCSGKVCEISQVETKFGKPLFIDFGDQLKKDAALTEPTVRIIDYHLNGNTLSVNVEFINPDIRDVTLSTTISCVYSYVDSFHRRNNDFQKVSFTKLVKAGDRTTQSVNLYLSGGSDIILSEPVIIKETTE